MIALRTLWSNSISDIEKFLNYTFSNETKAFLSKKLIKVATHTVNDLLDEETIVLCYCNPEQTCHKYNDRITIRVKGKSSLYKLWTFSNINYSMLAGGNEI